MTDRRTKEPESLPPMARLLDRIAAPARSMRLVTLLIAAALLVAGLGFVTDMHGTFGFDGFPVFYALYGFVMFTALILLAKGLRVLVKRPEDYYAPYAVDTEDYPEDQLERIEHDA